jgi:hypothetical protein
MMDMYPSWKNPYPGLHKQSTLPIKGPTNFVHPGIPQLVEASKLQRSKSNLMVEDQAETLNFLWPWQFGDELPVKKWCFLIFVV